MSAVLLLPPMANASGAVMVSTARITYRSAISSRSLSVLNMIIIPNRIASSHDAVSVPNTLLSTSVT